MKYFWVFQVIEEHYYSMVSVLSFLETTQNVFMRSIRVVTVSLIG